MIPIVFSVADDPVKLGLVSSLANWNGNAHRALFLSFVELDGKRLEVIPRGSAEGCGDRPAF